MKTILLTGGSGFIGKNIQESFLSEKYRIEAPSSKELNLSDDESVEKYFSTHSPDIIIHAAVKPGHRNAPKTNNLLYMNTRMFFNLEKYSNKVEKILIIGSGAIYDMRYYQPKMKEECVNHIPADEHGYCKYICNKVIERSTNIYDLRVFGIYGKYEDYSIRFISNAICKSLYDLPITIKQHRKFEHLYIDDLMPILDWFITHTPEYSSYNITPDDSIFLKDIALLVKEITNKKDLSIMIAEDSMGLEYSGDNSRLKKEYSIIHFTPINEGIEKLSNWYNSIKDKIDKSFLLTDK